MEIRYSTLSKARSHLSDVLDAAEADLPLHLERRHVGFAVMTESLLTRLLSGAVSVPGPEVYSENDGWTIVLPGTPVSADAAVFDEALDDFVAALREYVEDWIGDADLRRAASHRVNVGLVQFVSRLSDEQVRQWILHERPVAAPAL